VTDIDWKSLPLLVEVDPDEAEELRRLKEARQAGRES
jgi:hypothetical protein